MAASPAGTSDTPAIRLRACIGRFGTGNQRLFRAVRTATRKRLPAANELVYEYRDSLVVAYSPTDRPTESIVSISVRTDGVRLYFTNGIHLPDPKKLLLGSGRQTRFIVLATPARLADPDVEALVAAAIRQGAVPLPPAGRGRMFMRSAAAISARE